MPKKMVKIPDGVTIYAGRAKYKGFAPEHLVGEQSVAVEAGRVNAEKRAKAEVKAKADDEARARAKAGVKPAPKGKDK